MFPASLDQAGGDLQLERNLNDDPKNYRSTSCARDGLSRLSPDVFPQRQLVIAEKEQDSPVALIVIGPSTEQVFTDSGAITPSDRLLPTIDPHPPLPVEHLPHVQKVQESESTDSSNLIPQISFLIKQKSSRSCSPDEEQSTPLTKKQKPHKKKFEWTPEKDETLNQLLLEHPKNFQLMSQVLGCTWGQASERWAVHRRAAGTLKSRSRGHKTKAKVVSQEVSSGNHHDVSVSAAPTSSSSLQQDIPPDSASSSLTIAGSPCSLEPCPLPDDPRPQFHFRKYHTIPAIGCEQPDCRWIRGHDNAKNHYGRYHQRHMTGPDGQQIYRNHSDGRFYCNYCSLYSMDLAKDFNIHMKQCFEQIRKAAVPTEIDILQTHRIYLEKVDKHFSQEDEFYLKGLLGGHFEWEKIGEDEIESLPTTTTTTTTDPSPLNASRSTSAPLPCYSAVTSPPSIFFPSLSSHSTSSLSPDRSKPLLPATFFATIDTGPCRIQPSDQVKDISIQTEPHPLAIPVDSRLVSMNTSSTELSPSSTRGKSAFDAEKLRHSDAAGTSPSSSLLGKQKSSRSSSPTEYLPCCLEPCPLPHDTQIQSHFRKYHTIPAPGCQQPDCRWILAEDTLLLHLQRHHLMQVLGPERQKIPRSRNDERFHCIYCLVFSSDLALDFRSHMKHCMRKTRYEAASNRAQPITATSIPDSTKGAATSAPDLSSRSTTVALGLSIFTDRRVCLKKADGTQFSRKDELYLERVLGEEFRWGKIGFEGAESLSRNISSREDESASSNGSAYLSPSDPSILSRSLPTQSPEAITSSSFPIDLPGPTSLPLINQSTGPLEISPPATIWPSIDTASRLDQPLVGGECRALPPLSNTIDPFPPSMNVMKDELISSPTPAKTALDIAMEKLCKLTYGTGKPRMSEMKKSQSITPAESRTNSMDVNINNLRSTISPTKSSLDIAMDNLLRLVRGGE